MPWFSLQKDYYDPFNESTKVEGQYKKGNGKVCIYASLD